MRRPCTLTRLITCVSPGSDPAHTITLGDNRSPVISGAGPLRHLVSGKAVIDRLPQQAEQPVL
jgi:hypothetical protein